MKPGDRVGTATVTAVQHGLPPAPARERKRGSAKLTEKQFMAQVVAFAKLHGWLVYHTHDSRRSEPGFPDLVLAKGKRLIFAEVKAEGGVLTKDQEKWLIALRDAGAEEWCWWPDEWRLIERILSGQ